MKYIRSLQGSRQQYVLGDVPLNIGRSSKNSIVLGEKIVSRFHARIEQSGQQSFLIDLNSMWGTYVNGKRISNQHLLAPGDIIKIGSSQWQFFVEPISQPIAPSTVNLTSKGGYAFISYARVDSKIIDTLISRLKKAGYRVWVDRLGIGGGEHWRQEIVDAIENCTVFILALSSHSIRSENVRKEVDLADSAQRPIVPVELQQITDLPARLKYQLAGIQRINLATSFDAGFKQLLDAIESSIAPESAPWMTSLDTVRARSNPWIMLFILILVLFTCAVLFNLLF